MEYPLEKLIGKCIIFYSPKYDRVESWSVSEMDDEEDTKNIIKAWEEFGHIAIGLLLGYLDGEPQFELFEGHTVDEMKGMLSVRGHGDATPPGMKFKHEYEMVPVKHPEVEGL